LKKILQLSFQRSSSESRTAQESCTLAANAPATGVLDSTAFDHAGTGLQPQSRPATEIL
jgi:hypothetical protein